MALRLPSPVDPAHPGGQRAGDAVTGRQQLLGLGQTYLRRLRHRHQRHCPRRLTNRRHRHPRRRPTSTRSIPVRARIVLVGAPGTARRATGLTTRSTSGNAAGSAAVGTPGAIRTSRVGRSTTGRITVRKSTVGGTAIGAPCIRARGIDARGIDARGIDARGIDARGIDARGIGAQGISTGTGTGRARARGAAVGISCARGRGGGTDSRAEDVGMVRSAIRGGAIHDFISAGVVSAGVVNGSGTRTSLKCSNEGEIRRDTVPARVVSYIGIDDRHVFTGKCALGRPKGRAGDELIPPVAITSIVRTMEALRIHVEQIHHTSPADSKSCMNSSTPARHEHPEQRFCWSHRRAGMTLRQRIK
ncbi:hypothetical protein [Microbispora sp. H10885]|uniref:hypothetical protein n=1 Tax=Microbispora sp. H10885 TaxID=2729110 RepID=UPI002175B7DF|nr:hypothetical protein [Microbispora sp. H10885]